MRSPSRKTISYGGEGKVFTRKNVDAPLTAFERKLVAAREKDRQSQSKTSRTEKQTGNARDNLLQWQKHYRRAFPQFVFYFEGMTTEVHKKCSRQVHALGAVSFPLLLDLRDSSDSRMFPPIGYFWLAWSFIRC